MERQSSTSNLSSGPSTSGSPQAYMDGRDLGSATLGHVDQYFSDCAVLDGLVRIRCGCKGEPVQR